MVFRRVRRDSDKGRSAARRMSLRAPRVCLLGLSAITDDPRIRKQGNLLHKAGFAVTGVGLAGGTAAAPPWPIIYPVHVAARTGRAKLAKFLSHPALYSRYIASFPLRPLARGSSHLAEWIYWSRPAFRHLFNVAVSTAADVYVANDWNMLPIAQRLAVKHGGHYVYDSHEYAAEELPESARWRLFDRPLATRIEGGYIGGAALVSTVSRGIAEHLMRDYDLKVEPMVVRNVPETRALSVAASPEREAGEIVVLFHGGINVHRGLHIVVESVRLWNPGRRLVLRGPIDEAYRRRIEAIIDRHGLRKRVDIEQPVPADQLIERAATADVGIVSLPDTSAENRYALPNKIFEYISSGLALLVPQLDALAKVVTRYENGRVFTVLRPEAVAEVVNSLDMAQVNAFKAKSRLASAELVWEREADPWLRRIAAIADRATR
jgi:glycosyltransferase involved in cell wall biosynthesis